MRPAWLGPALAAHQAWEARERARRRRPAPRAELDILNDRYLRLQSELACTLRKHGMYG